MILDGMAMNEERSSESALVAGIHPVSGQRTRTLPVGTYRRPAKGAKKGRKRTKPLLDAVVTEVHTMEEKGSDVNLAAHLLNDAKPATW